MNPALTLQFERAVNEYARWQAVPAEDRSDAPAWWWDTALAAVDETALFSRKASFEADDHRLG